MELNLSTKERRNIVECGQNFITEGIVHPDRVMHEYDLLYIISGDWEIIVDDVPYEIGAGDAIILPPLKRHYGVKKCSPNMRNIFIHFTTLPDDFSFGEGSLTIPLVIHTRSESEIESLFKKILNIYNHASSENRSFLLSSGLDFLLASLSEEARISSEGVRDELVERVLRLFNDNPNRFYSQEELSALFTVSIRSLSSRFRKSTGTTLHAFQTDAKLDAIYALLPGSPSRTLRDFAISYGFYDEFQLSRLFKRKYGISPRQRRGR